MPPKVFYTSQTSADEAFTPGIEGRNRSTPKRLIADAHLQYPIKAGLQRAASVRREAAKQHPQELNVLQLDAL
jgi:hypothetical protein